MKERLEERDDDRLIQMHPSTHTVWMDASIDQIMHLL